MLQHAQETASCTGTFLVNSRQWRSRFSCSIIYLYVLPLFWRRKNAIILVWGRGTQCTLYWWLVAVPVLSVCSFPDAEGESLQSLLSEWDNPVFVRCPEVSIILHLMLKQESFYPSVTFWHGHQNCKYIVTVVYHLFSDILGYRPCNDIFL